MAFNSEQKRAYRQRPEAFARPLGAQRRIEARIGQLLGKAAPGGWAHRDEDIRKALPNDQTRSDYRLLARALDGQCELTREQWQKSRRALVMLVRHAGQYKGAAVKRHRAGATTFDRSSARLMSARTSAEVELFARTSRPNWSCWGNEVLLAEASE
jgi:hypothetical protein